MEFAYRKYILRLVFGMLHDKHILEAERTHKNESERERERNLHIFIEIFRIAYLIFIGREKRQKKKWKTNSNVLNYVLQARGNENQANTCIYT